MTHPVAVPAVEHLHRRVSAEIGRLGGRVSADFALRGRVVSTPAGSCRLPACIEAFLAVEWSAEHVVRTRDEFGVQVRLAVPFEVEAGLVVEDEPRHWYAVGYGEDQWFLLVDLAEAAGSTDPYVRRVDHEGGRPAGSGERLSVELAGLRVPRAAPSGTFARACAAGELESVREVLHHGADLGAVDPSGLTPLHLAVFSSRSAEVVRLLLAAGADPNAVVHGNIESLEPHVPRERAFGRGIGPGSTPLHAVLTAAQNSAVGGYDVVREMVGDLLAAGADPNAVDRVGRAPLHQLGVNDAPEVTDVMRLLLAAGADPNAQLPPGFGNAPLYTEMFSSRPERVAALLAAGADPCLPEPQSWRDLVGTTALHVAVFRGDGGAAMRQLLGRARDVDVRTQEGVTPLHLAVKHGRTAAAELLVAAGAVEETA